MRTNHVFHPLNNIVIDYQIGNSVVGLVTFALAVHVVVAVILVFFMRKVYVSRAIQD